MEWRLPTWHSIIQTPHNGVQICGGDRDTLYPDLSGTESTAQNLLLSFGHKILALARTLWSGENSYRSKSKKHDHVRKGHTRVFSGGEIGIRTLGDVAASMVFKTIAFDHSAISPSGGV